MWQRASRSQPCPICKRDHYCTFNPEKSLVRCTRARSDRPSVDSHGGIAWLHRIGETVQLETISKSPAPKLSLDYIKTLAVEMLHHSQAQSKRESEAERLGVSPWSLRCLGVGVGWTEYGREFSSWPSLDARNRVVGITRRFADGRKLCIKGTSNSGLFIPSPGNREYWRSAKELWIVEGGSDVAMAITCGVPAVGRPSNSGGSRLLAKWIPRHCPNVARVIVWGENDYRQPCSVSCGGPHCPSCFPGLYGAQHVTQDLKASIRAHVEMELPESGKDIREMLSHSDTRLPCHECRKYPIKVG